MTTAKRTTRAPGRGGRGGHEPRERIRARENRAVELSTKGWTQLSIAADLGVSQAAVSKILARADERYLEEISSTVAAQKSRQAQRLEFILSEALTAWAASKADVTRRRQRQTHGVGTDQHVAEVVSQNQYGDPRYLAEARAALRDVRGLFGLDAPSKIAVATTSFEAMTDEALQAAIALHQRLLQGQAVTMTGATEQGETDDDDPTR
jgi:transcriptional regulator with XRE-family HTH domain